MLANNNAGVLIIGNIRSGSGIIESAFIERIVTSPAALLQSSRHRGGGFRRAGDFVVCATANMGRFSPDLANRSLPIHLELIGSPHTRQSPLGNVRHEFLPANLPGIQAELCGLIENWKSKGMTLDTSARHPMTQWAQVIGGILKANGFADFLGNWNLQRNAADATREALGILALALPHDQWLRVDALVYTAKNEGVIPILMDTQHRTTDEAMKRQLGVILTAHRDEVLTIETDSGVESFKLLRARKKVAGQIATVYKFESATTAIDATSLGKEPA